MITWKKNYARIIRAVFAGLFAVGVVSCKTTPVPDIDPFAAIGDGADVYVFLPVNGNSAFLEKILGNRAERKDIKTALARTKKIYAGVFNRKTAPRKKDETLICAVGNYPANLAGMAFKESNGWTKYIAANAVPYYSGGISGVSLPDNKNALLVLADPPEDSIKQFVENSRSEQIVPFSENFDRFVTTTAQDAVGIFVKNPNFLIAKILGTDLQLPVTASEIYLFKKSDSGLYTYSFSIATGNKMTAFALSLVLRGTLQADVKTSGMTVLIENGKLSEDDLGDLLEKVFD